jgi:Tfp pilus assembly protein PilF
MPTHRPWIEVRSPNFVLVTDVPESHATKLSGDLELFRSVVQVMTNPTRLDQRVPTRIYAFASSSQARDFLPDDHTAGIFLGGMRSNSIALDSTFYTKPVVYHEYVHFLSRNQDEFSNPLWYEEGYAEFLSSVRIANDHVIFGGALPHRVVPSKTMPSFADVIRTRSLQGWNEAAVEAFYVQSWLVVHYFMLGPGKTPGGFRPRLARYVDLLDRSGDEDQAFVAAFGMSLDEFDRTMQDYAGTRRINALRRPIGMFHPATGYTVQPIAPAEVATQLGWLAVQGGHADVAERLFTEAIAGGGTSSRSHAGLGEVYRSRDNWDAAEPEYQRALALAPDDFENHLDYGAYLYDRACVSDPPTSELVGRARAHYQRAIDLAPQIPEGHAQLGVTYLAPGEDPRPGIESLTQALQLLPAQTELHLDLARLYLKAGQTADARATLRQVLRWSHGGGPAENAAALLQQIDTGASPAATH